MADNKPSVLVVDDELSIRESFSLILSDLYDITLAASGEAAIAAAAEKSFDLIYLDIRMPGMTGLAALQQIKKLDPNQEVIMVTAVNDVHSAHEAVKMGAREYLVKPFDVDQILALTHRIISVHKLLQAGRNLGFTKNVPSLPGQSLAVEALTRAIAQAAAVGSQVHLIGPAGVEKEWVARLLHQSSPRSSLPFEVLEIAGLSEGELDEKLFGKSEGVMISLLTRQKGWLEELAGGTIFINNIQKLPPALQTKLLAAAGDVRIISGSPQALGRHEFSVPLIEKLDEISISIPPLSERMEDIPALLAFFADKYSLAYGQRALTFSAKAREVLTSYAWPGNMDELAAMVGALAASHSGSEIDLAHLPLSILFRQECFTPLPFDTLWSNFEKQYVRRVLNQTKQNKVQAAKILGMGINVLETKI